MFQERIELRGTVSSVTDGPLQEKLLTIYKTAHMLTFTLKPLLDLRELVPQAFHCFRSHCTY